MKRGGGREPVHNGCASCFCFGCHRGKDVCCFYCRALLDWSLLPQSDPERGVLHDVVVKQHLSKTKIKSIGSNAATNRQFCSYISLLHREFSGFRSRRKISQCRGKKKHVDDRSSLVNSGKAERCSVLRPRLWRLLMRSRLWANRWSTYKLQQKNAAD